MVMYFVPTSSLPLNHQIGVDVNPRRLWYTPNIQDSMRRSLSDNAPQILTGPAKPSQDKTWYDKTVDGHFTVLMVGLEGHHVRGGVFLTFAEGSRSVQYY